MKVFFLERDSLSSDQLELFESLRKEGSNYTNSNYDKVLIVDDDERQLFKARFSRESPNNATIQFGKEIKSVAPVGMPTYVVRVVVDPDAVSYIHSSDIVYMIPIECLTQKHKEFLDEIDAFIKTS